MTRQFVERTYGRVNMATTGNQLKLQF